MEGRYGFSEGFPEGKSEGWNGRPKACPPGGEFLIFDAPKVRLKIGPF